MAVEERGLEQPVQSVATLLWATLIAGLVAAAVILIAILPAEYNVDPTGLGKKMGLTQLAPQKQVVRAKKESKGKANERFKSDRVEVLIQPGKGIEYKLHMFKGNPMLYSWSSSGGALYFDFHGEPQGDTSGYFESYTESSAENVKGSFKAPFEGSHGWYWKNKTAKAVTVELNIQGQYEVIGIK